MFRPLLYALAFALALLLILTGTPLRAQPQPQGVFVTLPPAVKAEATTLRTHAAQTQRALTAWLAVAGVESRSFWITNQVYIPHPTKEVLQLLRDARYTVEAERIYHIPPPVNVRSAPTPQGVEWGVKMVRAPEVWAKGYTGQGTVVAVIDTGFDPTHPAIASRFAGLWLDPGKVCPGTTPCDNQGHGTHVTGTILGDDGKDNQIGVAPGAKFIACKGCESSWCSQSSLLACGQWILDPHADGSFRDRPHIVNNSWASSPGDQMFRQVARAWAANGILAVFANGNSGPACDTAQAPGDYPEVVGVGAVDFTGMVASFSSRGPSRTDGGLKPNIAAPGVNIRSAKRGGGYQEMSGTSMGAPHASGLLALLWERAGGDIAKLRAAVEQSASPRPSQGCGESQPVPNYAYGWGIVDALAALERLAPEPPPPPPPPPPPENEAPVLDILEPADGAQVPCGQPVRLRGRAFDPEDGDISDRIVWWRLYPAWRGAEALMEGLTGVSCDAGWHRITAEVTDSTGARVEQTIMIEVVETVGSAQMVAVPIMNGAAKPTHLTPITGPWGHCEIDFDLLGRHLLKAAENWFRKFTLGK